MEVYLMLEKTLNPSLEKRIGSLPEYNRRKELETLGKSSVGKHKQAITFSREFGCKAYPAAERLLKR